GGGGRGWGGGGSAERSGRGEGVAGRGDSTLSFGAGGSARPVATISPSPPSSNTPAASPAVIQTPDQPAARRAMAGGAEVATWTRRSTSRIGKRAATAVPPDHPPGIAYSEPP